MFKRLFGSQPSQLPSGSLKAEELNVQILSHYGVPDNSSVLAYDHINSILAVGTRLGLIKIYGNEGIETSFYSPSLSGSKYLEFSPKNGLLINVNMKDEIEVWSLETKKIISSVKCTDDITAFFLLPDSPYIYFGYENGDFHVAEYDLNKIEILSFSLPLIVILESLKSELNEKVSLVGILSQPEPKFQNVLLAYSNGIILLWNLKESKIELLRGGTDVQRKTFKDNYNFVHLNSKISESKPAKSFLGNKGPPEIQISEKSNLTSVCWVCPRGRMLAAGYDSGEIAIWDFEFHNSSQKIISGIPIRIIMINSNESGQSPVMKLLWCNGFTHNLKKEDENYEFVEEGEEEEKSDETLKGVLFVMGGCIAEATGRISVFHLKELTSSSTAHKLKQLPWYGTIEDVILIKDKTPNSNHLYSSLTVLSYPSLIHVYDKIVISNLLANDSANSIQTLSPFSLPFLLKNSSVSATHTSIVLKNDELWEEINEIKISDSDYPKFLFSGLEWPFNGGKNSSNETIFDKKLFFIGLNDGHVHIFYVKQNYLYPFLSAPSKEEYPNQASKFELREVEAIDFCPKSGILVAAYADGIIRFFVFSKKERILSQFFVTPDSIEKIDDFKFAVGFQCIALFKMNDYKITVINLSTGFNRLILGDENGNITIINIKNLSIIRHFPCFFTTYSSIVSIKSCILKVPSQSLSSPKGSKEKDKKKKKTKKESIEDKAVIFITNETMNTSICDLQSAELIENSYFQPSDSSKSINLHLLKEDGSNIETFKSSISLKWMNEIEEIEEKKEEEEKEKENEEETIKVKVEEEEKDKESGGTVEESENFMAVKRENESEKENDEVKGEEENVDKKEKDEGNDTLEEEKIIHGKLMREIEDVDEEDGMEKEERDEEKKEEKVEDKEKEIEEKGEDKEKEKSDSETSDNEGDKNDEKEKEKNDDVEKNQVQFYKEEKTEKTNHSVHEDSDEDEAENEYEWIYQSSFLKNLQPSFVFVTGVDYTHVYFANQILNPEHPEFKKFDLFDSQKNAFLSIFGVTDGISPGTFCISNEGKYEIRSLPDFSIIESGSIFSNVLKNFEPSVSKIPLTSFFSDGTFLIFPSDFEIVACSISNKSIPEYSSLTLFDRVLVEEAIAEEAMVNKMIQIHHPSPPPHKENSIFGSMISVFKLGLKQNSKPIIALTLDDLKNILSSPSHALPSPLPPPSSSSHETNEKESAEKGAEKLHFSFASTAIFAPKKNENGKKFERSKTSVGQSKDKEIVGDAPPRQRTAEEIKALYGKSSKPKNSNDMASVLSETQQKLAQRGQKLQNLGDMAEQLNTGASTFAQIAAQIEKREREKKWWQL